MKPLYRKRTREEDEKVMSEREAAERFTEMFYSPMLLKRDRDEDKFLRVCVGDPEIREYLGPLAEKWERHLTAQLASVKIALRIIREAGS